MKRDTRLMAYAYLKHWLLKEDKYSQQSPFIFSVYQGALDCLKKKYTSSLEEKVALLVTYFCQLTPANQILELGAANETCTGCLNQIASGKVHPLSTQKRFVQEVEAISPALLEFQTIDFILIHSQFIPADLPVALSHLLPQMNPEGILFFEGIHQNKVVNACWKYCQAATGIQLTLDFFDFGVAFLSYSGAKTHLHLAY